MEKVAHNRTGMLGRSISFVAFVVVACVLFFEGSLPAAAQSDSGRTAMGKDLTVAKGEVVNGDVTVTNGNLTVLGEVRGEIVVAKGDADIQGTVEGDITVTAGNIRLG